VSNAHSPFKNAWIFLKELDTQDFRQAARTGGLRQTPERQQAYKDEGVPYAAPPMLPSGTQREAERMMSNQRAKSPTDDWWEQGGKNDSLHPVNIEMARNMGDSHNPTRDDDVHHKLTQGDNMQDPSIEQEPERVGRFGRKIANRIIGRKESFFPEYRTPIYGNVDVPDFENQEISSEGGEEHFPAPDREESPSNQAFEAIQQRRNAAEGHERVLADRQREMQMNALRAKMQSQPTMLRQQRGRRGQGPNSRKNRMKQNR